MKEASPYLPEREGGSTSAAGLGGAGWAREARVLLVAARRGVRIARPAGNLRGDTAGVHAAHAHAAARRVELLAQPQLELARGLLGEGHHDHRRQLAAPGRDQPHPERRENQDDGEQPGHGFASLGGVPRGR